MTVSIEQYRAAIGNFNNCSGNVQTFRSDLFFWMFIFPNFLFCHMVLPRVILLCGDIETNPGPVIEQSDTKKSVQIGHANVRSIMAPVKDPNDPSIQVKKFVHVKNHVLFYKYDLFGISESWLDNSIDNDDLVIPGYFPPIRRDISRHQQGTMVYLSKSLPAQRRENLEPQDSEIICVEIQVGVRKILVCNCYRPPHKDVIDFCSDIDDIIASASNSYDEIIFIGDVNGRNTLFWNGDITNTEGRILNSIFESNNFEEMIHEPTRIVGETKSCIDLIFTRNPFVFSEVGTREKIVPICDHLPVYGYLSHKVHRPKAFKRFVWNFDRADYDRFRTLLLHAPWQTCYQRNNVNATVSNWMEMFVSIAEDCIPHYEATIRPGDKDFMDSNIRLLMRKRDRLRSELKSTYSEHTNTMYKHYRNLVLSESRKSKFKIEKERDEHISQTNVSSRDWWKLCRESISQSSNSVTETAILNTETNMLTVDNSEKAELFNKFFVSQSNLDDSDARLPPGPPNSTHRIEQLIIQPEVLYSILVKLDPNKSTGPDGIGNRILREAAVPIAEPLSILFNFCISLGHFPNIWKLANVIPIHKKNDVSLCTNYRPISLLPCISKVFEKALFDHIYGFLRDNNLIRKNQSGFTPGDSTINQLIMICNNLYKCVDNGDEMVGIFLDLTKAFDKVWHKGLLYKVERIGIGGNLLSLLNSYLTGRKQRVVINGCRSSDLELKAGVPQGSVLGPLLFLIYINDIVDEVSSDSYLFADDTCIFRPVLNGSVNETIDNINEDLRNIHTWARQWLITINASKTVAMFFSRKRLPSALPQIFLGTTPLERVDHHKHLGIILSSNLSWGKHIESITSKCNRKLGIFKRFKYRWSRSSLELCYKSFVRPILEYGNILFDNCTVEESNSLESVQLEAARIATGGKKCTSHDYLYKELGWQTLKQRRTINKLFKLYCIINKQTPSYLYDSISSYRIQHPQSTRCNRNNDFKLPKCKTKALENSFFVSTCKLWNSLKPEQRNIPSKIAFKAHLNKTFSCTPHRFNHNTSRHTQVVFMQIRMKFSNLNDHLKNKGCIEDNSCSCGLGKEDAKHYFIKCTKYNPQRKELLDNICAISQHRFTLSPALLLYGSDKLTPHQNDQLFEFVYKYINDTKRFI